MDRTTASILVGFLGLLLVAPGCGDGATNAPTASISGQQQTAAATPNLNTPQGAVTAFLDAVKSGNQEAARGMLTPLAVQKTEEHNLNFSPPGSESATFQVGEVKTNGQGLAHVGSQWTDLDESGNRRPENITWTVKQDGSVWRISGMIAEIGPGQPPVVINFEQPDELLRRQEQVAEQPVSVETRTASQPEDPFQSTPRQ